MFVSLHLLPRSRSFSLSAAAVVRGLGYCSFSIHNACLQLSWRESVEKSVALFMPPTLSCVCWLHGIVFQHLAHFLSTVNGVFVLFWSALLSLLACTQRHIV